MTHQGGDEYTRWQRYFSDVLVSGAGGEIDAAARASAAARARGADDDAARTAGKRAARDYRNPGQAVPPPTSAAQAGPEAFAPGSARIYAPPAAQATPGSAWPELLAPRLFSPPVRWGWRAAEVVAAPQPPTAPPAQPTRPVWIEPPPPDTSALRAARSRAVTGLVVRVALTVIAVVAYTTYEVLIEEQVDLLGPEAREVYPFVAGAVAVLLAVGLLTSAAAVRNATGRIRAFEQPYKAMRAAERARHQHALEEWERAVREFEAASRPNVSVPRAANGPLWYPVRPLGDPIRLDVLGGDPGRHGWASLLLTLGTSLLTSGKRITLLDLTGQDVGGGLLQVAAQAGVPFRRLDLRGTASDPALLVELARRSDASDRLAEALTVRDNRPEAAEERAFATTVLRQVVGCLQGPHTYARLAAAVHVLRQAPHDHVLLPAEVLALTEHVGDVGQGEWAQRRLRFLAAQLDLLRGCSPDSAEPTWFAASYPLSVITTPGRRDDAKELIDRVLVQLAQLAMDERTVGGFLFVAGADHLGAHALRLLSDHARHAQVRLALMIDHVHGGIERSAGTGGAVCVMKMYNHHDANMAAEFIGRGHKFVLNQMTRQVGKAFTDTGGDSFVASTTHGSSTKQKRTGGSGGGTGLNESRGHTWTGTRGWSSADNLSTSSATSRVYEFVVEPQEIMGMPETAFILVDNSGSGRQVVMADANPGICLQPRVAISLE